MLISVVELPQTSNIMEGVLVIFSLLVFEGCQVSSGLTLSSGERTGLTPEGEACTAELSVNREKIIAVNWFVDVLPEDDWDYIQFMGCLAKKLGVIKSNGEMDFDKINGVFLNSVERENLSGPGFFKVCNQIVIDSVNNCRRNPTVGSTEGHTALKTLNCVARNIMETINGTT